MTDQPVDESRLVQDAPIDESRLVKGGLTDQQRGARIASAAAGFGGYAPDLAMGGRQVLDALAQMGARGVESITSPDSLVGGIARKLRKSTEDTNQAALSDYQNRFGEAPGAAIVRGGGQALVTAPITPFKAAASIPAAMGQGAALGGLFSGLTPIYNAGDDFWTQKAKQAATGAAGGALTAGALGVGAKLISPNVSAEAQTMLDAGITPTPGQILGGAAKTTEEKLSSMPVVGDAIRSAQRKGLEEYNVALYNRILSNIGQKYKGPAGQEGIAAVGDRLSAAYDSALARSVPSPVSNEFLAGMDQLTAMVPQAKRADFADAIAREVYAKVTPTNTLTPSVAKDAESALGRLYRTYASSPGDDQLLAQAYRQAQANLRNLVAQNNPQISKELQGINRGWSDLVQLENAANTTKAARAGIITPADQLRGIKKSDVSVRDRNFARGEMPNQDFAQAADRVLSNKYPDSGSIGRLAMNAAVGGGAYFEPTGLGVIGAGLGSLPYLPGGRQVMAALMARRPQGAQQVSDLALSLAPYLGAAAPIGLFGR